MARIRKPRRNPSFFKVLIGDFNTKLRIPPAFVKYVFKEKVPAMFTLYSDSTSSPWRVTVRVKQGKHFFIVGWSKFVKDHRLEIGDFLVFHLLGSSKFDVHIYNRTACSKNIFLSAKKRNVGRPPLVDRQIEETSPTKTCSSVSRKARGASRRRDLSQEIEFISEIATEHVSFVMVVKESNKYYATVPSDFAKESGLGKESKTKIKDPRGRIWTMNTYPYGNQFRLGSGWSQFVRENGIVAGDSLLFELIRDTGNLIQVQIVMKPGYGNRGRRNKQANAPEKNTSVVAKRRRGRPCRKIEEPTCSKRTKGLISKQDSFVVNLKDYQRHSVVVPRSFAEEMGWAEKPTTVIKDSKGKEWTLNILKDKRSFRLGAGWSKFVDENKLEVGDSLSFRHIPNTGNVINFKIITKAGEGTNGKRDKRANVN